MHRAKMSNPKIPNDWKAQIFILRQGYFCHSGWGLSIFSIATKINSIELTFCLKFVFFFDIFGFMFSVTWHFHLYSFIFLAAEFFQIEKISLYYPYISNKRQYEINDKNLYQACNISEYCWWNPRSFFNMLENVFQSS